MIFLLINSVLSLSPIKLKPSKCDIIPILNSIKNSYKYINKLLSSNLYNGKISTINIHNEQQQEIDIISNNIIKNSLLKLKCVYSIISEVKSLL